MNKIINELELAKKQFVLKLIDNTDLVDLTLENVAKVEAMILTDSAYRRSSDENAGPKNKKLGSTAFYMKNLKYSLINNSNSLKNDIFNAVCSVDIENSTHLNADQVGRQQMTDRIFMVKDKLIEYLQHPENSNYHLIDILSQPTIPNDSRHKPRVNWSFATKFCHFASFTFFKGTIYQDNFSIADQYVVAALDKYAKHYKLITKNKYTYKEYIDLIDQVIKCSGNKISRNGFDHLLWYYYKSRINNTKTLKQRFIFKFGQK